MMEKAQLGKYDNKAFIQESHINLHRFNQDADIEDIVNRKKSNNESIKILNFSKFSREKDDIQYLEDKNIENT